MSKADTPQPLSPEALADLRKFMAERSPEFVTVFEAYADRIFATIDTLQSTLDRLSEPGEGCRGCGGIVGPYCVECGEAAAQQQAGSPKKKSEE